MAFCSKCGSQLEDGAKFCPYCGEQIPHLSYKSKRTEEYAGKIVKCPACGTELPSFTAVCPSCGHEINSSKMSDSLKAFARQIDDCDRQIALSPEIPKKGWSTWGTGKKVGWVFLNLFFAFIPLLIYVIKPLLRTDKNPTLTKEEKHKATIIENYQFPNDRGSILEALMFIKSKVSFLASEKANANNVYWTRLWTKMAEQLYQKAEIMFPGDQIVNSTYRNIAENGAQVRKKLRIRLILTVVIVAIVIVYLGIRSGSIDTTNYNVSYDWPQNEFTEILPEPNIEYGKITSEYTEQFQFELYKVAPEQFEGYAKACREKGFNIEITKTDGVYYANNEEGYDLNIFYYEDEKEMHVSIDSYDVKK